MKDKRCEGLGNDKIRLHVTSRQGLLTG